MLRAIRPGAKMILLTRGAYEGPVVAEEGLTGTPDGHPGRTQCLKLSDGREVHVDVSDLIEVAS